MLHGSTIRIRAKQQRRSLAKANDDGWDIAVRYANEFNGVRIAAGIAYQER